MRNFALLFVLGLSFTVQAASLEKLQQQWQSSPLAWQLLESLTVEIGPRLAGSPADARAVSWAEQQFKRLGYDKIYKQPVQVRYWQRGPASARILAP